jgi:outer membrane protein assembly factor BamB
VRDVVVIGLDGGLAAYNVVDGKLRWKTEDVGPGHYLSLSDRLIVALDAKGVLRTYVPSTGVAKWTAAADAQALLAADDDAVYVMTADHRLRSVGRSDARIRWTARIPARYRGRITVKTALDSGRLVLVTNDGHVLAMATDDGSFVWELRDQGKNVSLGPAAHNGVVYVNGKALSALRITDGKKIWTRTTKDMYRKPAEWGPVSVFGSSVYSVGGAFPERLAADSGKPLWDFQNVGGSSDSYLLPQGSGVVVIDHSFQTEVAALSVDEGEDGWTYELPEAEQHGLAVGGNRVFVRNGDLLCALPIF